MSINPISGPAGPIRQASTPMTEGDGAAAAPQTGKIDFDQTLRNCLDSVNGEQENSSMAIEDLLAGRTQDVLPAVAAVAKADLSFKLLMGVRNKIIDAYKQTMNMQI